MALTPIDKQHAVQIQAGILGRKSGHAFEDQIVDIINNAKYPLRVDEAMDCHVYNGEPASLLLSYIAATDRKNAINRAIALSTGALATSEDGKKWLDVNGVRVHRYKSDIIVTLQYSDGVERTAGVSTKQCNNTAPTNAQLCFTTARGFSALLNSNGLTVSERATTALRQFCGDKGFRPTDISANITAWTFLANVRRAADALRLLRRGQ